MAYCTECDAKILGTGYVGSGKCVTCYAKWHPAEINPAVPVAKIVGDVCPTCGQRLRPLTPAEKQRRYRERKKAT